MVSFLLSKFEQRSLNAAASSCGRGYFRKRSSCGRGYFFIRIKKDAFSKISGYVWTRREFLLEVGFHVDPISLGSFVNRISPGSFEAVSTFFLYAFMVARVLLW